MYVDKCAVCAARRRGLDVRVLQDNGTGLAPQFQQHRLHVLAGQAGNNATNKRAACEVNLLHGSVRDQGARDVRSVGRPVVEHVQATCGEASFTEQIADGPECARTQLGALEHGRVTRGQREGHRADSQNDGGVPGLLSAAKHKKLGGMRRNQ